MGRQNYPAVGNCCSQSGRYNDGYPLQYEKGICFAWCRKLCQYRRSPWIPAGGKRKEQSDSQFSARSSTGGDISYVQESEPADNKAFFMENAGQLRYGHLLSTFKLDLKAAYSHTAFNYYGNTFGNDRHYDNENQTLGVFNLGLGMESDRSDRVNYSGFFDYRNFATGYGLTPTVTD